MKKRGLFISGKAGQCLAGLMTVCLFVVSAVQAAAAPVYSAYRANDRAGKLADDTVTADLSSAKDASGSPVVPSAAYDETEAVPAEPHQPVTFSIAVNQSGYYALRMTYYALPAKSSNLSFGLKIDGELPFKEARDFLLNRLWADDRTGNAFDKDQLGDDIVPLQKEVSDWETVYIQDTTRFAREPALFYLEEGLHDITVETVKYAFLIGEITFCGDDPLVTYEQYLLEHADKTDADTASVKYEAELSYRKSSNGMAPTADRSSPDITPNDPNTILLNTIGGTAWEDNNQWISWIVDVPVSGFYSFTFRYKQNFNRSLTSCRSMIIDGSIPYQELASIAFPYALSWSSLTPSGANGQPLKIFLEEGEREIRLAVCPGEISEQLNRLMEVVSDLNAIYRTVITVTGINPDPYRDYYLDREIVGLMDSLAAARDAIKEQVDYISRIFKDEGNAVSFANVVVEQLNGFIKDPRVIQKQLANFSNNINAMADMILSQQVQPLTLDYFIISSPLRTEKTENAGFFSKLVFRFRSFINSFFRDYSVIGGAGKDNQTIKVWMSVNDVSVTGVSVGREQTQILKRLIDRDFTKKYDCGVDLSLVNTGEVIIQSILAGTNPDVTLFASKTLPVVLALRESVVDLSKDMPDFDSVKARFHPSSLIAFELNGGIYALPDTQTFNMMFYRSDILEQLSIEIPQTWDDFYKAARALSQANMDVGVHSDNLMVFESLLFQNGGSVYTENMDETMLYEPEAIQAFSDWTKMYTHYSLPAKFDFISRFRSGEMPIIIIGMPAYNSLSVAAPEIRDAWGIAPIPGTKKDGGIDRTTTCLTAATFVLTQAKNKDDCFNFIDWWTSADVQSAFGNEVEAVFGPGSRYYSANQEVLESLPWTGGELAALEAQWAYVTDIPQTPASYYYTRSMTNAFRNVIFYAANTREMLFKYSNQINEELHRKRLEFNME